MADLRLPIPVLRRPGGYSGEPEPDPIPNSAVKLSCANGTKSRRLGRVGRCQACQAQGTEVRNRKSGRTGFEPILLFTIHDHGGAGRHMDSGVFTLGFSLLTSDD